MSLADGNDAFAENLRHFSNGEMFSKPPLHWCSDVIGPCHEKTCLRRFANNKGADQPAHPRSLISAFVILVLKSTISKFAISRISTF